VTAAARLDDPARHAPQGRAARLAGHAVATLGASAVVLAFASTVNKPLANVSFGVAVLAWGLLVALRPATLAEALRDRVVQGGLALFALYAASLAWTDAPRAQAVAQLGSYRVLLFPLLFHAALSRPAWARRALAGLLAGIAATLALSLVQAVWPLPFARATRDGVGTTDAYIWSDHIRQNVHVSLLYLWALGTLLFEPLRGRRTRLALAVLVGLVLLDILLLVKGRTGYVTVAAITLVLCHLRFGWRGTLAVLAATAVGAVLAYFTVPRIAERIDFSIGELRGYLSHAEANNVGVRVAFWRASLAIAAQAPWFGHGIDAFRDALAASGLALPGTDYGAMHDPHNEFLYVLVELGAVGLALLLAGLLALVRLGAGLADPWRWLAIGGVALFATAGLFNGMLNLAWIGTPFGMLLAIVAGAAAARRPGGPAGGPVGAAEPRREAGR
jgi:O-antigen ligase